MIEKIKKISNPLTIVGIFAALAEVSGTVAIIAVNNDLQQVIVWFVVLFPILLVLLFFLTLNFNPKVLYSPSDYKDESYFFNLINKTRFATADMALLERSIEKIREDINEVHFNFQTGNQAEIIKIFDNINTGLDLAIDSISLQRGKLESAVDEYYKTYDISFDWKELKNWKDSGAKPEIIQDNGEIFLKANYSEKAPGMKSNCSMHRRLQNIIGGSTVEGKVLFKCDKGIFGMIHIGDIHPPDPYDNAESNKKEGNGDWQELVVRCTYTHDDNCTVHLYGNRDDGKLGDFALYRDLRITVKEPVKQ